MLSCEEWGRGLKTKFTNLDLSNICLHLGSSTKTDYLQYFYALPTIALIAYRHCCVHVGTFEESVMM